MFQKNTKIVNDFSIKKLQILNIFEKPIKMELITCVIFVKSRNQFVSYLIFEYFLKPWSLEIKLTVPLNQKCK